MAESQSIGVVDHSTSLHSCLLGNPFMLNPGTATGPPSELGYALMLLAMRMCMHLHMSTTVGLACHSIKFIITSIISIVIIVFIGISINVVCSVFTIIIIAIQSSSLSLTHLCTQVPTALCLCQWKREGSNHFLCHSLPQ